MRLVEAICSICALFLGLTMEKEKIKFSTNPVNFSEVVFVIEDDQRIWAIVAEEFEGKMIETENEIDKFIADELVEVFNVDKHKPKAEIEFRDNEGDFVEPFRFEVRRLVVSPNVFGHGWTMFVNGKPKLQLSVDNWAEGMKIGTRDSLH